MFVSLETGEEISYTYSEVNEFVGLKTRFISTLGKMESALLVYDDTVDFITSFLACQRFGIIPIPLFYPKNKRHFERLVTILDQSGSEVIFCSESDQTKIANGLQTLNPGIKTIGVPFKPEFSSESMQELFAPDQNIAFIQYTSGSTSAPKGVIVTHQNVLSNQQMIQEIFKCDENSVILSWLPFYHDMGLIGNLLHAIYSGCTCILMRPFHIIGKPVSWFEAIEKYNVTHSGGPNFIYDLCVSQISLTDKSPNLSSWKVAYNGSEPIRKNTVDEFIKKFQTIGFNPNAYHTCYGLAEATLIVSGGTYHSDREEVSSGAACTGVSILLRDSNGNLTTEGEGEICLFGAAITEGYWRFADLELFVDHDGKKFLRTGDLGKIQESELFVTGRLKEMIIINGKNYFPYEIENALSNEVHQLEKNGVIVSFIEENRMEKPIVFGELSKAHLTNPDYSSLFQQIDNLVSKWVGMECFDIVLLTPRKLDRTSSGKLQRLKTKEKYLNQELDFVYSKRKNEVLRSVSESLIESIRTGNQLENIRDYLIETYNVKLKIVITHQDYDHDLLELGIDSLKSIDLVNTVNHDLGLSLEVNKLLGLKTTGEFEEYIKNLLWLKNVTSSEEEIII